MPQVTFGKYQMVKKLATGGMAEVWLARQTGIEGFNRHVVVKRILPHLAEDPEFVQMFLNEAKIAARFNHPNIAQIYELGQIDGSYFIAMEFIHGEDLGRLMRKAWSTGQWIARPLAIRIVASACEGLHYAHTRMDESGRPLRVVHRDISPQNILISFDGSVKVVDFGIAKAADQASMTKSGAIKGKFAYMAPEQAAGKPLDARTDTFALGLVLYELLTGVRPLKRDSELATLQAALECAIDPPSVVAEVPSELDEVVMKALAKAPDDRYKDSRSFQMALEEFLISQRLVATSVQISELMETLFADRRAEEARLGAPNPASQESISAMPAMPEPPPEPSQSRSRSGESRTGATENMTDPGGEALPSWDAPPAAPAQPSRKYAQTGQNTAYQRTSDPNLTRAKPGTALNAAHEPDAEPQPPPRARRRSASDVPTADVDVAGDPPATDAPPRRTSSGAVRVRRTSSGAQMPEAPARRSRPELDPVEGPPKKKKKRELATDAALSRQVDDLVDVTGIKQRQQRSMRAVVFGAVVLGALALGFVFREQLQGLMRGRGVDSEGRVSVLLTVSSNPKTRVTLKRRVGEPIDLGEVPIDRGRGASVGDTVVMSNADLGIYYEEEIQFGQPGENRVIVKEFGEGKLRVEVKPSNLKGLSLWRGNQKVANVGIPVTLYEGAQKLEVRGEALKRPVEFDVNIVPNQVNVAKVELTQALQ